MFNKKYENGEKYFKCPRDRTKMDKITKNNVIIDVCPKCNGMWLDDNEIEKLLDMNKQLQEHGKRKSSKKKK